MLGLIDINHNFEVRNDFVIKFNEFNVLDSSQVKHHFICARANQCEQIVRNLLLDGLDNTLCCVLQNSDTRNILHHNILSKCIGQRLHSNSTDFILGINSRGLTAFGCPSSLHSVCGEIGGSQRRHGNTGLHEALSDGRDILALSRSCNFLQGVLHIVNIKVHARSSLCELVFLDSDRSLVEAVAISGLTGTRPTEDELVVGLLQFTKLNDFLLLTGHERELSVSEVHIGGVHSDIEITGIAFLVEVERLVSALRELSALEDFQVFISYY